MLPPCLWGCVQGSGPTSKYTKLSEKWNQIGRGSTKSKKKLKTKNRNNIICGTRGCLEGPNLNIETAKNFGEERGKCRKNEEICT